MKVKKMINLLPPEEKNKLKLKRTRNLAVILSGMVLISLVSLILILLLVKFSILSEADYQKTVFDQAKKDYQSKDAAGLKNVIKNYNAIIPQVLSFYQKEVYFSDILASLSKISRPDGLYFTSISLDGIKYQDRIAVIISGKSDTRENLLSFQKDIEAQSQIKNINFSPESWISPENISFSLNFDFLKNVN